MAPLPPKYYRIKQDIIEEIESGQLPAEAMIPSEAEWMKRYQVSRITVRKAFDELAAEGYLYRIQGKGTFVSGASKTQGLLRISSYTEEILRLGMAPSRIVLSAATMPSDGKIADALRLSPGASVFVLERVYRADGEPLCFTRTYLPPNLFPGLESIDFEASSLYDILESRYNCQINRSLLDVDAVSATETIARYLGIAKGAPILHFGATTYGIARGREEAIEHFDTYYLTNRIRYTLEQFR